jgi:hypothetical protein
MVQSKGNNQFQVRAEVRASRPSSGVLQYRFVTEDGKSGEWQDARPDGDGMKLEVLSPNLEYRVNKRYALIIEARDQDDPGVERYPFNFRVTAKTDYVIEADEAGPKGR